MRRRRAPLAPRATPAALATATLLACGFGGPGADDPGTLTVLDPGYEAIFNPSWSMPARFLVYSPLVGPPDENGEAEPRLARRWTHSDDYREWTFHLRPDVRWHDGAPFTARDVAFTLAIMSHPDVAFRPRPDTVIVVDDSTVTVRRSRPWRAEDDWWWVYYPEHLLGDVEPGRFFDTDFWIQPVGTGPFRYARHLPRTVFELDANPDYFGGEPAVNRLRIKFGGGSPLVELRSGNVDAVLSVSRAELPRFLEDQRFRVYEHIFPGFTGVEALYWNHRHPFLADARVRRALTTAIDREELRRLLHLPEELAPVFDVLFTTRQFWAGEPPPGLGHDPERAAALLDSVGWRDLDGDGVRERGGHEARFTALLRAGGSSATAAWDVAAVYIQEALRRVGVRMEIRRTESGVPPLIREGEFEAAFGPFNRVEVPKRLWGEDSPLGYHDPELYRLLAAADALLDPAAQDSLYRLTWPILQRDLPVTFLSPQVQHFAAHRRVRGLTSPFRAHPYIYVRDLWLEVE